MQLLTDDTFSVWKEEVARCKDKLIIFTPYFNSSLLELFDQTEIDKSNIDFVTCISEEYLLNNIPQVIALKEISNLGINIYHLPKLHAKVLIRDDDFLSVGSQNFTSGGRSNKEATSFTRDKESIKNHWENTFSHWIQEAKKVPSEFIDKICEKIDHEEQFADLNKLKELINETKNQAKEKVLAHKYWGKKIAEFRAKVVPDPNSTISSFVFKIPLDGFILKFERKQEQLRKYSQKMCPTINLDTNEVKFARVARTRISRLGNGVSWSSTPTGIFKEFDGDKITIEVTLKRNDKSNLYFSLRSYEFGEAKIYAFFDGFSFSEINIEATNETLKHKLKSIFNKNSDFFGNLNKEFGMKLIHSFYYATPIKSTEKIIHKFLKAYQTYLVSIIQDENERIFLTIKQQ